MVRVLHPHEKDLCTKQVQQFTQLPNIKEHTSFNDYQQAIYEARLHARQLTEEAKVPEISREVSFHNPYLPGDKVWLFNPLVQDGSSKKLSIFWEGPYSVLKVLSPVICEVSNDLQHDLQRVNIARLKKVIQRDQKPEELPEDLRMDNIDDEEGEVVTEPEQVHQYATIDQESQSPLPSETSPLALPDDGKPHRSVDEEQPASRQWPRAQHIALKALKISNMETRTSSSGRTTRYYLVTWKDSSPPKWVPHYDLRGTGLIQEYQRSIKRNES